MGLLWRIALLEPVVGHQDRLTDLKDFHQCRFTWQYPLVPYILNEYFYEVATRSCLGLPKVEEMGATCAPFQTSRCSNAEHVIVYFCFCSLFEFLGKRLLQLFFFFLSFFS